MTLAERALHLNNKLNCDSFTANKLGSLYKMSKITLKPVKFTSIKGILGEEKIKMKREKER